MGKRHYPIYKIVAADSRFPRDGRFIEAIGTYNPNLDPMEVILKEERVKYWLNVGAQPTDTVRNLLQSEGLILKLNLEKKGVASEVVETEFQKFLSQKESKIKRAKEKKIRRKLNKKVKKDNKDSTETKVTGSTAEPKANEKKFGEAPASETSSADTKTVDTPVTETPSADTKPADTPVAETPSADTKPVDTSVAETPSADTKPADTPVAETPSADTKPVDTPVTETPSVDTKQADAPVAEPKDS